MKFTTIRLFLSYLCFLVASMDANAVTVEEMSFGPYLHQSVNVITGECCTRKDDANTYEYTNHPFLKKKLLARVDKPEGDFCIYEYYDKQKNPCGDTTVIIDDPVRDSRIGRVKLQKTPFGPDKIPIITARYFYYPNYTEVYDALNRKTIYKYHDKGYLTAIENYQGNDLYRCERFFWTQDSGGESHLAAKSWEDGKGNTIACSTYAYNAMGKIISNSIYGNLSGKNTAPLLLNADGTPQATGVESYSKRWTYDEETGLPQSESEDNGKTVLYRYNALTKSKIAEFTYNRSTILKRNFFEYTEDGKLAREIVDDGNTEEISDIHSITERHTTVYRYTNEGTPIEIEKQFLDIPSGQILTSSIIKLTENDQASKTILTDSKHYTYNYAGEKIAATDAYGNAVLHDYDALGRVMRTTFPQVLDGQDAVINPTVYFSYDIFDNLISETDANGHTTTTVYTIRGKPAMRFYPDGTSETFTYNLDGTLRDSKDAKGVTTVYERDLFGRELSVNIIASDGQIRRSVTSTYTAFHLIETVKDGTLTTRHTYTCDGKLAVNEQTFPEGFQRINYSYDEAGRIAKEIETWGNSSSDSAITEHFYDAHGNPTTILITTGDGDCLQIIEAKHPADSPILLHAEERAVTNSRGQSVRQTIQTNHQGITTATTYDAVGRAETVCLTNSFGKLTSHTELRYDPAGNKVRSTTKTEGLARTDQWTYDACNRITSAVEAADTPFARTTWYRYNACGQLELLCKPSGVILAHTYTSLGQLKSLCASDNTVKYQFFYDLCGNLIKVEDQVYQNITSRDYDTFGHIVHEELGNGLKIDNIFDAIGRRTLLTLHDNSTIAYEYDPLYLRTISRFTPDRQLKYVHTYSQYTSQGDFREMTLIGAIGSVYFSFDEKRRCHSVKSPEWTIDIPPEGFDASGNIVSFISTDCMGTYTAAFDYDDRNQLTAEHGTWQDKYLYDARGNRISADPVNILDQLNDVQITYDLCGNSVSAQQKLYRYDALDRLTAVEIPNETTTTYTYDAFHRRLTKSVSTWDSTANRWNLTYTLRYLYDGEKEIGVADSQGNIVELRVLGTGTMGTGQHSDIGAAVAVELDSKVYAPIHDFRGNVCCLLSQETGKTAESYRYSAFGKVMVLSPDGNVLEGSALHNPWMFSSKRLDTETGLVYYGNRYYETETGRWTTKDPLGTFDGPNPYVFLHNNPLYSIDLTGLFSWSSAWNSAAYFMHAVKKKVSLTETVKEELDILAHATFSKTFLQLSGYYEHQADSGRSLHGEELSDQVRITLINGILNVKMDLEETLKLFSKTHGDTAIHYVFHPTEGWSKDLINSMLAKFGYTTPYAQLLAHKWKELIQEMGGIDADGTIIHYAHSTGATDTYVAKNLLSPEEQQMIHVITLGSPILIPNGVGFGSTINYVSKRDGVCLLDPIGYINGLVSEESNVEFLGTFWGIPIIDHTLYTETYGNMIKDLGNTFKSKFGSERS